MMAFSQWGVYSLTGLILVISAAMVVPRLVGHSGGGIAPGQADLTTFSKQLSIFRLDVGRYPTTAEGLSALRRCPANAKGWKGPYLEKDPGKDPWGHPYIYKYPGNHGPDSFLLESAGPTGNDQDATALIESD